MDYAINKVSHYIETIFRHVHSGTVHSVYRKTINLTAAGQIAALQAADSPLSPISFISALSSSDMEKLSVKKGNSVRFFPDRFMIQTDDGLHQFFYEHADKYDLLLPGSLSSSSCLELAKNIAAVLNRANTGGLDILFGNYTNDDIPLLFLAAKQFITKSTSLFHEGQFTKAAEELSHLLGLGIGLTPSGDDFLCGLLAGLRLTGQENTDFARTLKAEISKRLTDTLDVSAAFLTCALENQFSLAVNHLYTVPSSEKIWNSFSEIGHSSGMDTLCGILYALQL